MKYNIRVKVYSYLYLFLFPIEILICKLNQFYEGGMYYTRNDKISSSQKLERIKIKEKKMSFLNDRSCESVHDSLSLSSYIKVRKCRTLICTYSSIKCENYQKRIFTNCCTYLFPACPSKREVIKKSQQRNSFLSLLVIAKLQSIKVYAVYT